MTTADTTAPTTPADAGFVHLHVHTEYSMLDGLGRVKDVPKAAKAKGQSAVAMTDHGNLSGAWAFREACLAEGVKPIIGVELYLALGSRFDPQSMEVPRDDESAADEDEEEQGKRVTKNTKTKRNEHLTVLARTATGWTNLVSIMNKSQETFYVKPLADFDLLKEHGDGLIVLTGCLGGPVAGPISRGDIKLAEANLETLIEAVGKENVYVEIMEHGIEAERNNLVRLRDLADKHGLTMVVTNDCHYVESADAPAHEAWLAVQSKKSLKDPNRFHFHGDGYHLGTSAEMRAIKTGIRWQQACDATVTLAARIADDVIGEAGIRQRLPQFPIPAGFADSDAYLFHLIAKGAKERYAFPFGPVLKERLRFEFNTITGAGIGDYFLIVWDLMNWSRSDRGLPTAEFPDGEPSQKRPILNGYGRGSAAGSVTSYALHIVGIDPIENDLLFERFLEPGRVGMPDIDLDFETDRRAEILAYLEARYGKDKVARIGTVGKALSRRAVKDAARVLDATPLGNKLSKAIPVVMGKPFKFSRLADTTDGTSEPFRQAKKKAGDEAIQIVDLAVSFEGVVNGASIHACGTIISDESLESLIPLRYERDKNGRVDAPRISNWDGGNVESFGLLKLDVLGLRNLDIVSTAAGFIKDTTGEFVDMFEIPHPNTQGNPRVDAAWDLLCAGKTNGVFQMESSGMARLSEDVSPRSLNELSAVIALYRPGALSAGSHTRYVERKHGRETIEYSKYTNDPAEAAVIDSILGETQGVFVYQEQLMRLSGVMCGFNISQRSQLRKAVGKKIEELMRKTASEFIEGAVAEHKDEAGNVTSIAFSRSTAEKVWKDVQFSADYLFNKSHSAAYAQLSYVTAFLKANWPVEYGAAILAVTGKGDKRAAALASLREDAITVLPPDINISAMGTTPHDGQVRLGLSEIKGVGTVAEWVVAERVHGEFASLADLIIRTKTPDKNGVLAVKLSLGAVEALIESGACDVFGPRLGQMIALRALRSRPHLPIPDANWGVVEQSARQRAALGVALDLNSPLMVLRDQLKNWTTPDLKLIGGESLGSKPIPLHQLSDVQGYRPAVTLGLLARWEQGSSSNGIRVNFAIEGTRVTMDGIMWNEAASSFINRNGTPAVGSIVAISGSVESREIVVEKTEVDEEGNEQTVLETHIKREIKASKMWLVEVVDPVRISLGSTAVGLRPVGDVDDDEDAPEEILDEDVPLFPVVKTSKPKLTVVPDPETPIKVPVAAVVVVVEEPAAKVAEQVERPVPAVVDPDLKVIAVEKGRLGFRLLSGNVDKFDARTTRLTLGLHRFNAPDGPVYVLCVVDPDELSDHDVAALIPCDSTHWHQREGKWDEFTGTLPDLAA